MFNLNLHFVQWKSRLVLCCCMDAIWLFFCVNLPSSHICNELVRLEPYDIYKVTWISVRTFSLTKVTVLWPSLEGFAALLASLGSRPILPSYSPGPMSGTFLWQTVSYWMSIQMHFYRRNRGVCLTYDEAKKNAEYILSHMNQSKEMELESSSKTHFLATHSEATVILQCSTSNAFKQQRPTLCFTAFELLRKNKQAGLSILIYEFAYTNSRIRSTQLTSNTGTK